MPLMGVTADHKHSRLASKMAAASGKMAALQSLMKSMETKQICRLGHVYNFSTCCVIGKNKPSTVGVPAWAKASNKRSAQVLHLEKKKSARQLQAEWRLSNPGANKSDFQTTTRVGVHRAEEQNNDGRGSRIAVGVKEDMVVFYHPAENYPVQHTKFVNESEWTGYGDETTHDYRGDIPPSELVEIRSLQESDPKLWSLDVLSQMFKVKPFAISNSAPLTAEQQLQLEVEHEFLEGLSEYEREEYDRFKNLERRKVLQRRYKQGGQQGN